MRLGGSHHQFAHCGVVERGDCIRDGAFGFGTTASRHRPDRSDAPIVIHMKATIDLVTDGQPQLTPKAAAILADIIRKAVADQQHGTETQPTSGPVEPRS
jgi:hypothetical protein